MFKPPTITYCTWIFQGQLCGISKSPAATPRGMDFPIIVMFLVRLDASTGGVSSQRGTQRWESFDDPIPDSQEWVSLVFKSTITQTL